MTQAWTFFSGRFRGLSGLPDFFGGDPGATSKKLAMPPAKIVFQLVAASEFEDEAIAPRHKDGWLQRTKATVHRRGAWQQCTTANRTDLVNCFVKMELEPKGYGDSVFNFLGDCFGDCFLKGNSVFIFLGFGQQGHHGGRGISRLLVEVVGGTPP
jgi:hypothetical protein